MSSDSMKVSVQDACDNLWSCQTAAELLMRLKTVHQALLKDRVDAYDPSEAFLAIQGAALRFLPFTPSSSSEGEDSQQVGRRDMIASSERSDTEKYSKDEKEKTKKEALHWSIAEEALLAAAALACVCVGPAWHSQTKQRRLWLSQNLRDSNQSTLAPSAGPPDALHAGYVRSFSLLTESTIGTNSSIHNVENEAGEVRYPRIPEIFPAALLRYAESILRFIPDDDMLSQFDSERKKTWEERRTNTAIGQRCLVLALCCETPGPQKGDATGDSNRAPRSTGSTQGWTIPGVHELVGDMLLFWLRLACPALQDTSLSQGTLLRQQRVNLESTEDLPLEPVRADELFWADHWYILAVCRAAVDLIATGWRSVPGPRNVVPRVVLLLLQVADEGISILASQKAPLAYSFRPKEKLLTALSASAEAISALATMGSRGLIPHELERKLTSTTCQLHVLSGIIKASLFRVEENTIFEILRLSDSERGQFLNQVESCLTDTAEFLVVLCSNTSSVEAVETLIEIISASNPKLSVCELFTSDQWSTGHRLVCRQSGTALRVLSATFWRPIRTGEKPANRHENSVRILGMIVELGTSLHKVIRQRLEQSSIGAQATIDMLSLALDLVVSLENFCNQHMVGGDGGEFASTVEWETFFAALEDNYLPWVGYDIIVGLGDSSTSESIKAMLDRSRIETQALMLRVGALLDKFARIDDSPFQSTVGYESQEGLYQFILRKVVPAMDSMDGELLGLSVTRSWVRFGLFPFNLHGWFEISMKILEEIFLETENGRCVHSARVRLAALRALVKNSSPSALHQNTEDRSIPSDGSRASQVSLIPMLLGDASGYHEQVTKALLVKTHTLLSLLTTTRVSFPIVAHCDENTSRLNRYTISLAGALVRDVSIDREKRAALFGLLQELAMKISLDAEEHTVQMTKVLHSMTDSLRLEAIRELEKCLDVPFGDTPLEYWIVPRVMETLVQIAGGQDGGVDFNAEIVAFSVVAMLILARFRMSDRNMELALLRRGTAKEVLAKTFADVFICSSSFTSTSLLQQVAPLVKIGDTKGLSSTSLTKSKNTTGIQIDFTEIIASILKALRFARSKRNKIVSRCMGLLECLSSMCFHVLEAYWSSGIEVGSSDIQRQFMQICGESIQHESSLESFWRSRCLSVFAQRTFAHWRFLFDSTAILDSSIIEDQRFLFELLLRSFDANNGTDEREVICGLLIACLPTIVGAEYGQVFTSSLFAVLASTIQRRVALRTYPGDGGVAELIGSGDEARHDLILFLLAHQILLKPCARTDVTMQLELFYICSKALDIYQADHFVFGLHIVLRCMTTIIERLPESSVVRLRDEYQENRSGQEVEEGDPKKSFHEDGTAFDISLTFCRGLLADHLAQRIVGFPSRYIDGSSEDVKVADDGSFLQTMAIELESHERFEVENGRGDNAQVVSTWFDSESFLLTLRVGSSESRFRGWLEVTIRTPSLRTRRMIRLLSKISLSDPHTPLSIWSDQAGNRESTERRQSPVKLITKGADDDRMLAKYNDLVSRFDTLIPPTQPDELDSQDSGSNRYHVSASKEDTEAEILESVNSTGNDHCILKWLKINLDDDDDVNDAVAGLLKLGISKDAMRGRRTQQRRLQELQAGSKLDRSIAVLDRTIPCHTHKLGLLYSGPSGSVYPEDDPESELLSNQQCSPLFHRFAEHLGEMITARYLRFFSAGLDISSYESDGRFTRAWTDQSWTAGSLQASRSVIVYHIPSLMPEGINNRKRHIGNDNVLILFADRGSAFAAESELLPPEYKDPIVSGHFGFVTIYVCPMIQKTICRVTIRIRKGLQDDLRKTLLNFTETKTLHIDDAPAYVRAIAIQTDLACRCAIDNLAPPSNVYERYRMLRQMKRFTTKEDTPVTSSGGA